jgi:hypothetical protein
VIAALWLIGCASRPFEDEIAPMIAQQCSGCHGGDAPRGELDLSGDPLFVWAALVDEPSWQTEQMPLVQPGDYLDSYLWHKMNGTQVIAGGSGSRMPLGVELPAGTIEALALWIDEGANP